jgi:hypothetical protein
MITQSGGGTYPINLLASPPSVGVRTVASDYTNTVTNSNTITVQPLKSFPFAAGSLNAPGKAFRITTQTVVSPATSINSSTLLGWGTSATMGTTQALVSESSSSTAVTANLQVECMVFATGSGGSLLCTQTTIATSGTTISLSQINPSVDLTVQLYFGFECQFSGASASNTCSENQALVEQLN